MNNKLNKTVVVTGGLGMIGSFVCDRLLQQGMRVVVVDDESKGGWTYCNHLLGKVEHRKGTLEDPEFALDALQGADIVYHLASRTCGVGFSSGHHLELLEQNNRVSFNVLAAVTRVKPQHLLVTSSSCVYSDESPTPMDDTKPWVDEPEWVNRGYGWAKRTLEQLAMVVCSEVAIPLTIVRPVNVYGERYHWIGDASQAIPMITRRIMEGENPLVIWGSGQQSRSYVHANDCAKIMVELVDRKWCGGPVNIGSEETITLPEAASIIATAAGKEVKFAFDRAKPEGRLVKAASSKRLREALGIGNEALWSIEPREGMKRMVEWYEATFRDVKRQPTSQS